jgi:hypothetical protein
MQRYSSDIHICKYRKCNFHINISYSRRIWFVVLDNSSKHNNNDIIVIFTTGDKSVKGKDMLRDPRVSLCVCR